MRALAHIISFLLHPALIPTLTIFFMVWLDPLHAELIPWKDLWNLLLAVLITTGILPTLSIFILYRAELIQSVYLERRKDRFLPFIITLIYLIATYIILLKPDLPSLIYAAFFGGIVAFTGLAIMNIWWRVSVHLCAYSGFVGAILGLFSHNHFPVLDFLALLILLGGILASARIRLEAHTLSELALGTVWGFLCSFFFVTRHLYLEQGSFSWLTTG